MRFALRELNLRHNDLPKTPELLKFGGEIAINFSVNQKQIDCWLIKGKFPNFRA